MKTTQFFKNFAMLAAVAAFSAGCASTQQEQPAEPEKKVEKKDTTCQAELAAAEAARKKAASVGGEWRDTGKIIKKAKEALAKGDGATCVKLATKALHQGELGYAQALREQELANARAKVYTVAKGDSLWKISANDKVYGDPYQWPLIYKANRHQIKDADLIHPGQELDINHSASAADVAAAVKHAKTRGAWAVGVVEDSDKAYLAQ